VGLGRFLQLQARPKPLPRIPLGTAHPSVVSRQEFLQLHLHSPTARRKYCNYSHMYLAHRSISATGGSSRTSLQSVFAAILPVPDPRLDLRPSDEAHRYIQMHPVVPACSWNATTAGTNRTVLRLASVAVSIPPAGIYSTICRRVPSTAGHCM
jgi:hypothetical protein